MKIKEVEKTVNLAWSPKTHHPILLAAGTAAQQLDASFNTSAALELYSINLGDPSLDMDLCCSSPSEYRFHKLVWGPYSFDGSDTGVIVGGCDGGRIVVYNAAKLLNNENGVVACLDKHSGPVRALDFNHFQKNLLTSGASKSEIFIWDMSTSNLNTPMTPGATTQPLEDVVSLSWNKQVEHILASAFPTRCIVWDLRKSVPVIKLSDSASKVRWKVVTWNPQVATQLCLASEDDQYPVVQLWDLRFASSPIKTFEGHQKGVLAAAWCDEDPDLLISCGKDNKLLVWNINENAPAGEIICDMPISTQWNFEVDWCPRNPFLVSSSSFDGRAAVYSLSGGKPVAQTTNKIADSFPGMTNYPHSLPPHQVHHQQHPVIELLKPPKWMKKPVGVSFAFGGKLVTFNATNRTVNVSQVVTEPDMILKFKELLDALEQNNIFNHCYKRMANAADPSIKEIWNFIACQFYGESFKNQACSVLGASSAALKEKLSKLNISDESLIKNETVDDACSNISRIGPADNEDIFGNLTTQQLSLNSGFNGVSDFQMLKKPLKIVQGDDINGAIVDALLLDNKELAVSMCIKNNRMADAIILAESGGPDLFAKALVKYFEKNEDDITTLISAVVSGDWCNIVETCDLWNWKQVLLAILNHTKDDVFRTLSELLGQRLLAEGDETLKKNALICYVCAGNINQILNNWKLYNTSSTTDIQELVELGLVMREAMKSRGVEVPISGALAEVLVQYAELLASQGYFTAAYTYLGEATDSENMKIMKDRLAYVLGLQNKLPIRSEIPSKKPGSYFQSQPPAPFNPVTYPTTYEGGPPPSGSHNGIPRPVPQQAVNQFPSQPPFANNQQPFNAPNPPLNPPIPTPKQLPTNVYSSFQPPPVNQTASQVNPSYPNHLSPSYPSTTSLFSQPQSVPPIAPPTVTPAFRTQPSPAPHLFNPSANSQFNPPSQVHPPSGQTFAARSTPTPPVPPPVGPYNSARQTPDHVSGQTGRNKYVVDPSVKGGTGHRGSFSNSFQSMPSLMNQSPLNTAQPFPSQNESSFYQMTNQNSSYPVSQPNTNMFIPNSSISTPVMQPSAPPVSQTPSAVSIPPAAPGWNDPPSVSFEKPVQKQTNYATPMNPITHPLYGSVPEDNLSSKPYNPTEVAPNRMGNYPSSGIPPDSYQNNVNQMSTARITAVEEPPKPKRALPEEHIHLQTVLEELRIQCSNKTGNAQMRRKLEDVARKLEMLYDAIRENKLSNQTLGGLHEIANAIQQGNYQGCLSLHTQLVSGPEFSTIASFMPGIKVLVQSALQLEVYI